MFDKIWQVNQAAIVDNKQLGVALEMARVMQAMAETEQQRVESSQSAAASGPCAQTAKWDRNNHCIAAPWATSIAPHQTIFEMTRPTAVAAGPKLTPDGCANSGVDVALGEWLPADPADNNSDISTLLG